jgi:hypothetical protein
VLQPTTKPKKVAVKTVKKPRKIEKEKTPKYTHFRSVTKKEGPSRPRKSEAHEEDASPDEQQVALITHRLPIEIDRTLLGKRFLRESQEDEQYTVQEDIPHAPHASTVSHPLIKYRLPREVDRSQLGKRTERIAIEDEDEQPTAPHVPHAPSFQFLSIAAEPREYATHLVESPRTSPIALQTTVIKQKRDRDGEEEEEMQEFFDLPHGEEEETAEQFYYDPPPLLLKDRIRYREGSTPEPEAGVFRNRPVWYRYYPEPPPLMIKDKRRHREGSTPEPEAGLFRNRKEWVVVLPYRDRLKSLRDQESDATDQEKTKARIRQKAIAQAQKYNLSVEQYLGDKGKHYSWAFRD